MNHVNELNTRLSTAINASNIAELKRHGISVPTDATVQLVHKLYLAMLNERFANRDKAFTKAHP